MTDSEGNVLPFATIYVVKIQKGTATNAEGSYRLGLSEGSYEVRFQYLGYQTRTLPVIIKDTWVIFDAVLEVEPVELNMVEIVDNREDPAYTIMRRAIAKAKYHTQRIDHYNCKSYLKGSGRLKDVPGLFRRRIEKAMREEGIDSTTAFVTESVSEITYNRPNQFKEKVISVRSVGNDNSTSPNRFINSSFYQSEIVGAISPLSPKAFAYYRFEYLGFFSDHGLNINKIKVTPRSAGDLVFEGTIYIVDNLWSIHSLDLDISIWGITFNIKQIFEPILENVWLPVNHIYEITGSFFGFDFEYQYFAHLQDYNITLNPDLEIQFTVIDDVLEKEAAQEADKNLKKSKEEDPVSVLTSSEDISRKQLRKALRKYEKAEMEKEMEKVRDTTDVDIVEVNEFSIDSNAYDRDSVYWQSIRPIPLTKYELKGYHRMDSLSIVREENERSQDTLQLSIGTDGTQLSLRKGDTFRLEDILLGGSYKAGIKTRLGWQSVLTNTHFNTVEGYHLKLPFFIRNIDPDFRWRISPELHYSFARKRVNGIVDLEISTGDLATAAHLKLSLGRKTSAYCPGAIDPYINDFYSLLLERNYLKKYEHTFISLSWDKKVNAKNTIELATVVSSRRGLENQTGHTLNDVFERQYTSNFPENISLGETVFDTSGRWSIGINWITEPWLKYRLENKERRRIENSSPKFKLSYRASIDGILENSVSYHKVDLEVSYKFQIGARGDLSLRGSGGLTLNPKNMTIADLNHFPGNRTILTTQNPVASFRLLPYYKYSTKSGYSALYSHFQFRKLLLSRFPFIRRSGIKEAVFANVLETREVNPYLEVGYGINYILRILRIEGGISFIDGKYHDWGIRIGVASNFEDLF